MNRSQRIHNQYEQWPYPQIPIIGSVRQTDTWQINLAYLKDRCGLPPPPLRPRILIAGCGTFQPYVFALANPNADILATDISQKSLNIARFRNLLHGITGVTYQIIDLNQTDTYPDGPFDYIECYGVLMNLDHPEKTLKGLAARLADNGIIRIMVYPHFGRQRIFQIQRLAKLLELNSQDRSHPGLLRKIILSLSPSHPLSYAFTTYRDSQNDAGIVDGFLHAGDRGFTGYQLGDLIANAGCKPAFYFHRPWGQPETMAKTLGFANQSQSFILHYLDIWQELRTNFIVCLIKGEKPKTSRTVQLHPLLKLHAGSLSHRLRMRVHRLVGITLPSRTEADPIHLSGADLRALSRAIPIFPHPDPAGVVTPLSAGGGADEKALQWGILLGGKHTPIAIPAHAPWLEEERCPVSSIAIGSRVANPFYEGLFKAYTFERDYKPAGLAALPEQIEQWRPIADPLEESGQFGQTPFGTYMLFSKEILDAVTRGSDQETVADFDSVRYAGEDEGIKEVLSFLKQFPNLPKTKWNDAALRELWILLFSTEHLFLDSSRIG